MKDSKLIESFQDCYANLCLGNIADFSLFYDKEIQFKDPIIEVSGLRKLQNYTAEQLNNIVHWELQTTSLEMALPYAVLTWTLNFRHTCLKVPIHLEGITRLKLEERILFQQNYYDVGALLYERLPGVGAVLKFIKRRFYGVQC